MKTIQIYEPNQRAKVVFLKSLLHMLQNVNASKGLMWQLFRRDFLMAYKRSFLGMSWLFISPVFAILSWVFYNYIGVLNPGSFGVPYPIYVLLSTSIWGYFMGFYTSASNTLEEGRTILTQVCFPHEAMLFKQAAQHIANFSIGFFMNIMVIIGFGLYDGTAYLQWQLILYPILTLPLMVLGMAIGLSQAPFKIVMPDLAKGMTVLMNLLLFITPVIYSDKIENSLAQTITKYNPLTYLIGAPRDMIFYGSYADWQGYTLSSLFALLTFGFCWHLFYLIEQKLIERML